MKTFVFLLLIAFVFSGCLLQPQITIKSASVANEKISVKLNSNKEVEAEVQLSDEQDGILCFKKFSLKQGNNEVKLDCSSSGSVVTVTVFAEGAVISKEVELEFDESGIEERVISLAENKTIEGRMFKIFEKNLLKQSECTTQVYIQNMRKYAEIASVYSGSDGSSTDLLDNLTSEQMTALEEQINSIKSCNMFMKKDILDFGNGEYTVSYSIDSTGKCTMQGFSSREFGAQEDLVVIEVNLKNNSAKTTSGAMNTSSAGEKEINAGIESFSAMFSAIGSCVKAFMLGVSPMPLVPVGRPVGGETESSCTAPATHIEIKSFGVEKDYIILQLMNTSDKEIQLTGITGFPVELTCYACNLTLNPGSSTGLNLQGDFSASLSEEVTEQLTISYTFNDFDYSEIASCKGVVGNFIEEIKQNNNTLADNSS